MLDAGPTSVLLATTAFVLAGLYWCRQYWDDRSHPPLPPGPPNLPILGSILSFDDPARPWLSFDAWRSTYGDIIYARLLSQPVVVINSEEVARDLFELRSTIYSDKPQSFISEYFAFDFNIGFLPYGDRWRLHRRILHRSFHRAKIPPLHAELLRSAQKMLFGVLQDPTNYASHIEKYTCSFILPIVYGYEPNDYIVHVVKNYLDILVSSVGICTSVVLETIPFLLQLPAWFPGATFKRASIKCRQAGHDVKEIPFKYVKERMSNEEIPPCLVADSMNSMGGFENDVIETAIKEVASVAFAAGSETTSGTLLVFVLAMVLHPQVQAKAQAEIDRVVGKDRLPNFDDRPELPYVDAVIREVLRWHPVAPMGGPHATTTSDIYKGYFIPKGIMVLVNIWAMTHNEKKYPSPYEFKPERFLHEDGSLTSDTVSFAFSLGRRICAGRHLADAALWIAIASFLSTFSVHRALDEHGEEIPVNPKFSTGLVIHPEKFPCRIIPRFPDEASEERLMQLTGLGPSINSN